MYKDILSVPWKYIRIEKYRFILEKGWNMWRKIECIFGWNHFFFSSILNSIKESPYALNWKPFSAPIPWKITILCWIGSNKIKCVANRTTQDKIINSNEQRPHILWKLAMRDQTKQFMKMQIQTRVWLPQCTRSHARDSLVHPLHSHTHEGERSNNNPCWDFQNDLFRQK